ncbi:MAG: LemA family protein [Caldilineae bacterium]|nr:LemA family protein [Chloroflexota bacterium]MCB9177406.1 LemA family protein [Caldilineae bacterium]
MNSLVVLGVLALVLIWATFVYNRLVALRNRAEGAWSDIDVQLKRRHDLVGNLVETVKGYASHERETFEAVVEARNQAEGARQSGDLAAAGAAESLLGGRIGAIFALAEAYPELKANEGFRDLQKSLGDLETAIQDARRYYNAVVRDLNTRIQSMPDMLVARFGSFAPLGFFELEDAAEAAVPQVRFGAEG